MTMTTQFLSINEGQLAYDVTGTAGPLVVCVPGMGDLRQEFRFLTPLLVEAGYRVATMDVRGHGESSTHWADYSVAGIGSDILALIRKLGGGPAVVIGSSMAAGAAVWAAVEAAAGVPAAAEQPELVSGLVLIGPAVHGEVGGAMRLLMKALFARPWGAAAWKMYYSHLFTTRKPADFEAYADGLKANLAQPGRLEALTQMILASKNASEARLAQVRVPTQIIMGSKDPDFKVPAEEAQWVADQLRACPNLSGFEAVEIIDGAGHYPHSEMPEITNPRIVAFLAALQTEEAHAPAARQ
jgi:pimeloyl-ACP methyl ester carboxylesterase